MRTEKESGVEMDSDDEKAKKRRLTREERKAAKASAVLESLDRELPRRGGAPPMQRPVTDPGRLALGNQPGAPPSLTQWSRSFSAPAAWTEPIATTYVQKRAMLAAMKGAKGEGKDATSQPSTAATPQKPAASQPGPLAPRFGAPRQAAPPPPPAPPPVITSRPLTGDLSRPRFAGPYNYTSSTPGPSKPSYPTVQPSKTVGSWSPAVDTSVNPYFRKYANPIEPEEKGVPYWQRRLDNPTASQQIRLIAQNWIVARNTPPKPKEESQAGTESEQEEVKGPDLMAPVPSKVELPHLPEAIEPEPAPTPPEAAELPADYDRELPAARDAVSEGQPTRRNGELGLSEDSYSTLERWASLKDFSPAPEAAAEGQRQEAVSEDDLDWESMVRKPKGSRRKRRKAAEMDWTPPAAEMEFREPEPSRAPAEPEYELREREYELREPGYEFREREYELREPGYELHEREYELREPQPEVRKRRGLRGRRRDYEEELPTRREHLEGEDVGRVRRIPEAEPEYDLREERSTAARHHEPPLEDRYARRASGQFDIADSEYPGTPPRRREAREETQPARGRSRRSSVRDTELIEMDLRQVEVEPEAVREEPPQPRARARELEPEPDAALEESLRRARTGDVETGVKPATRSKVKASRDATLVEDGLVYVLVDDEGRAVLH